MVGWRNSCLPAGRQAVSASRAISFKKTTKEIFLGCGGIGIFTLHQNLFKIINIADVAEFGIRARLRFLWPQGLGGSSPLIRT